MILVDTSVWIEFFRRSETLHGEILTTALERRDVCIGDLISAEVLQGIRNVKEERSINEAFSDLPMRSLCGLEIARKAAVNYRRLRANGITARGTIDVIIATWSIENEIPLLHNDSDFTAMESLLGLISYVKTN